MVFLPRCLHSVNYLKPPFPQRDLSSRACGAWGERGSVAESIARSEALDSEFSPQTRKGRAPRLRFGGVSTARVCPDAERLPRGAAGATGRGGQCLSRGRSSAFRFARPRGFPDKWCLEAPRGPWEVAAAPGSSGGRGQSPCCVRAGVGEARCPGRCGGGRAGCADHEAGRGAGATPTPASAPGGLTNSAPRPGTAAPIGLGGDAARFTSGRLQCTPWPNSGAPGHSPQPRSPPDRH